MKSKFKIIAQKPFIRNVIVMATGTAAAQLVSFLLQPVITRMYGPEGYGLMGVFMAIAGLLIPIATLTYPIAIVLPKSDTEAKGIIQLSLYITTGIAMVVGIVLLFFNQIIVTVFQLEDVAPYLYLIPLVILFAGILQVTEQWLIRKKQFLINAKVRFFHALILNGSKVGVGIFYPTASALIIISALGNGLKAFMMIIFSRRTNRFKMHLPNLFKDWIYITDLGKKYRDFPKFRAPQVFLYSVSQSLPILMLTGFFGPASAGFYTISRTVLVVPSSLLGKSVGDVFYPRISEAANNGENLTKLIKKAILGLGLVGSIPFGVVIIFGPLLFSFVFGDEWIKAGEYARWLALGVFFEFMNKPCVNALPVMDAQGFHLKYTVIELMSMVGALAIGYYWLSNDLVAVAFYGILMAVLNIILMIITIRISKRYDRSQKLT